MKAIKINRQYASVTTETLNTLSTSAKEALVKLHNKTGKGSDFLGWVNYLDSLTEEVVSEIQATANKIRKEANVLLVVGIGGSYLGSKSVIEALSEPFQSEAAIREGNGLRIYFVGHQMSASYLKALMNHIKDDRVFVNVISKSGTTTEPAVAFRMVKAFMESKYGQDYANRIIATTDESRGALRTLANQTGMKSYIIPDDVGGRFSVFTPVGLLPIACAGIDIATLVSGAKEAAEDTKSDNWEENIAMQYAMLRNDLYSKGKKSEILVNYEPAISFVAEWWKQLYGESEGKDGKGILPHAMSFTTDLHSLGQYVQEGERILFETVINIAQDSTPLLVEADEQNLDGLNFLAGKSVYEINQFAMQGTLLAHVEGGVPNIIIELAKLDAYHIGYLYQFFMKACGISGYMLDVNPFDQPGVEAYKKNMFGLLGKPGFEEIGEELRKKLK
jgi:glucose-6-phosphate isomerase